MNIIVFGGAGFVGSHVADALSEAGHRVSLFDLRPSPYLRKGQKMVQGDMLDPAVVDRAVKGHDAVYNFAGYADIETARHKPLETIRANILANGLLLEACRQARVKRYVFASSLYVYSAAGSFYRASKQACEAYIQAYRREYGLRYTILRFGSLYGPRSDARNGIRRLVEKAVKEGKLVYGGDGEETREYIHVQDAALSAVDVLGKAYEDQSLVLTGQQPMKVRDFLAMIREELGGKLKISFRPEKASDLHYRITPYSFTPQEAKKLVRNHYVDLGQGVLSLIREVHAEKAGGGR
jgi:UDP-glucose 4-epimerase